MFNVYCLINSVLHKVTQNVDQGHQCNRVKVTVIIPPYPAHYHNLLLKRKSSEENPTGTVMIYDQPVKKGGILLPSHCSIALLFNTPCMVALLFITPCMAALSPFPLFSEQ